MKTLFSILTAAVLLTGCAPALIAAYPAPPPLPAERLPRPPVADEVLTWRPGDWVFAGGSYRYEPGRYVRAAGHGATWQFGHWEGQRGAYVWIAGGWI